MYTEYALAGFSAGDQEALRRVIAVDGLAGARAQPTRGQL
jgi:hypothetical protein